jgi:hypothetical protein
LYTAVRIQDARPDPAGRQGHRVPGVGRARQVVSIRPQD